MRGPVGYGTTVYTTIGTERHLSGLALNAAGGMLSAGGRENILRYDTAPYSYHVSE